MARYAFLSGLMLISLVSFGRAKLTIPNCSCGGLPTVYSSYRYGCECFRRFPLTNESVFPALSLPINLTFLSLGIPDESWNSFRIPDCKTSNTSYSFITASTNRLKEGTDLQFISFTNFNFEYGRAKRMAVWLGDVKRNLTEMEIVCGRLVTLSAGVFVGFSKLRKLTITGSNLEYIEAGSFSELHNVPGAQAVLTDLDFSYNSMRSFDWVLLQPVAYRLQSLTVTNNVLERINPALVTFPKLLRLDLSRNRLHAIPESIVKTWPESSSLGVNLGRNPLCPLDSFCRCCSLLPLFRFVNRTNAWILAECGDLESKAMLNETSLPNVIQTSFCTGRYFTHMTVGSFLEFGNTSHFERCDEDEDPDAIVCAVSQSQVVATPSPHNGECVPSDVQACDDYPAPEAAAE